MEGLAPVAGSPFGLTASVPEGLAANGATTVLYVAHQNPGSAVTVDALAVAADGSLALIAGSPFPTVTSGRSGGVAYFQAGEEAAVAIPALGPLGLAALAGLLLLAGVVALRRARRSLRPH